MAAVRRLSLVAAAMLAGCAQPESDSLSFRLYDDGAMLLVRASASPTDATIELEWSMTIENERAEPCAVAVYAWVGDVPFPNLTIPRPNASTTDDYPSSWQGGALIDAALIEGDDTWTFSVDEVDEPSWLVYASYAIATCPNAALVVDARAEASVEYGPWSPDRGMYVELNRMD